MCVAVFSFSSCCSLDFFSSSDGLCVCLRVYYLCMGWRVVGAVKVCVIDKLLASESMRGFLYNHYNVFRLHDTSDITYERIWTCM